MAMTVSTAVVTGTATAGATPGITQTSIEGLFAALLGGGGTAAGGTQAGDITTLFSQALAGVTGGISATTQVPQTQQPVEVGNGQQVVVQGDADVVGSYMAQLQTVVQQIEIKGQLPSGNELSAALQKLGMPADQADQMAERIDTMMALLKKNQSLDDKTDTTLGAMLLAAMMGQNQGNGFQLQVTQVQESTVQVNVSIQSFSQSAGLSAADLARQMVAKSGKKDDQIQTDDDLLGKNGPAAAPEGKTAAPVADAVPLPGGVKGKASVVVDVRQSADGSVLSVPVQQSVDPNANVVGAPKAVSTNDNKAVDAGANTVSRVLDKPTGEVLYKWQADSKGDEKVTAVQPALDTDASAVLTGQQIAAQNNVQAAKAHDAAQSFADRLQEAAQSRAADQVAVQIKPVAESGGGTVRMTLNPPELGHVQIDLTIGSDGKVHGAIAASDPAVVEQLARELHSLRHGLADAGLKLGEQGINLMLSNNGNQQQGQGQQQAQAQAQAQLAQQSGGVMDAAEGTTTAQPEIAAHWVAPERVVDVRI